MKQIGVTANGSVIIEADRVELVLLSKLAELIQGFSGGAAASAVLDKCEKPAGRVAKNKRKRRTRRVTARLHPPKSAEQIDTPSHCRFCGRSLEPGARSDVCKMDDCQKKLKAEHNAKYRAGLKRAETRPPVASTGEEKPDRTERIRAALAKADAKLGK